MATEYVVQQGDCLSTIAEGHGLDWETIWNHSANADLVRDREHPNVLQPGDVLVIPDRRTGAQSGATEQRHRFRRKGIPPKLLLQLQEEDRPRANMPYTLHVDGRSYSGATDGEGKLEVTLPAGATRARLVLDETQEEYDLALGALDPISEISGIQGRLDNLGFECGGVTGEMNTATIEALRAFQHAHGLDESGEPDRPTRRKLTEVHGS